MHPISNPGGFVNAFVPNPSLYDGETVTTSVYLRSSASSGSESVNMYLIDVGNQGWSIASMATLTLTPTWQRYELTSALQNGLSQLCLQVGNTLTSGQGFEIWGAQFSVGTNSAPYTATSSSTTVVATGAAGTLVPNGLNQVYAYDSFGNILQNGSFNSTYTANNQMFGYPYDAAGNQLSNGLFDNMTWDAESRLTSVGGATYVYDAEGNRVEKQGATVTDTIYFAGQPIARLTASQWTDLIYGPTGLIAEVPGTQAGAPVYRLTDNLGTGVGSLLANGSFVDAIDHSPFGQVVAGTTNDPYFFTGKERDAESGLDFLVSRYYASNMGRFMSPDWSSNPISIPFARLDNPQTLNRYTYVGNNPLRYADAYGHSADCGGGGDKSVVCLVTTAWDKVKSWFGGRGSGSSSGGNTPAPDPGPAPQFRVTSTIRRPDYYSFSVQAGYANPTLSFVPKTNNLFFNFQAGAPKGLGVMGTAGWSLSPRPEDYPGSNAENYLGGRGVGGCGAFVVASCVGYSPGGGGWAFEAGLGTPGWSGTAGYAFDWNSVVAGAYNAMPVEDPMAAMPSNGAVGIGSGLVYNPCMDGMDCH